MYQKIFKLVSKEFSGKSAKELIGGIANFHRIQSSPGFRAAAKYSQEKLMEYKIPNVKTHSYPANGNNTFWGSPVPKEWSIESASLDLIEPKGNEKSLCRFFENPCSVIQRSKTTPSEGITGEVIFLPRGLEEKEMRKYDLKGKFILTDDPSLKKLRLIAVGKLGAAGIIYDLVSELKPIRTRANFPTARRYTSFWYGTKGNEGDALGFVLSAQQGDELRKLIAKTEKENEKLTKDGKPTKQVKVHAKVKSSFYNGEMEVVDFSIPGKEKGKEVLAVAHLCHPKPSAVDNASGCGILIETARILNDLIESGKLERPKRGIRFLLMAEFTGTYCYLASNEEKIKEFVAGINLDMVGADQTIGGGRTLIMERTHNACPSYVNDVLSGILDEASREVSNFQNTGATAMFKFANDQPFSGGSDHMVLGHPDVGVGTPMFIQWPDRYYHTGEDTIEKVSPEIVHLIGSLTATYCYFLANAELPEILRVIREVATKGKERITKLSRKIIDELFTNIEEKKEKEQLVVTTLESVDTKFNFRKNIELQALDTVKVLLSDKKEIAKAEELIDEMKKAIGTYVENEINQTKSTIKTISESMKIKPEQLAKKEKDKHELRAEKTIAKKTITGPLSSLNLGDLLYKDMVKMNKISEEYKGMYPVISSALFWIDGKRTIAEVAKLVENDIGKTSISYILKMLEFYKVHGIVEFLEKK